MPIDQLPPEDRRPDGEPLPGPEPEKTPAPKYAGFIEPKLTDKDKSEIWDSYIGGMPQRQIAEIYGVNQSTVSRLISKMRNRMGLESVEDAKVKDLGRLEALIDAHWKDAIVEKSVDQTKLVMGLIDQRGRIFGYTAPLKHRIEGKVGVEHSATPELSSILERVRDQNEAIRGELERQQIEAPSDDVVDAEVIEDGD